MGKQKNFAPSERGRLDEKGREILDPTPVAIPLDMEVPPTVSELVRRYVQFEASRVAEANSMESFDESNDFDIDDGFPSSPHEYSVDQEDEDRVQLLKKYEQEEKARAEVTRERERQERYKKGRSEESEPDHEDAEDDRESDREEGERVKRAEERPRRTSKRRS